MGLSCFGFLLVGLNKVKAFCTWMMNPFVLNQFFIVITCYINNESYWFWNWINVLEKIDETYDSSLVLFSVTVRVLSHSEHEWWLWPWFAWIDCSLILWCLLGDVTFWMWCTVIVFDIFFFDLNLLEFSIFMQFITFCWCHRHSSPRWLQSRFYAELRRESKIVKSRIVNES